MRWRGQERNDKLTDEKIAKFKPLRTIGAADIDVTEVSCVTKAFYMLGFASHLL